MDDSVNLVIVVVPVMVIFAGAAVVLLAMHHRTKLKELEYRERIAMIERGLAPPPERNPAAFDSLVQAPPIGSDAAVGYERASRHRTAGVVLIGLGFAAMLIISVSAGAYMEGIGIGGAAIVLGCAFLANALFSARDASQTARWPALSRDDRPRSTSGANVEPRA